MSLYIFGNAAVRFMCFEQLQRSRSSNILAVIRMVGFIENASVPKGMVATGNAHSNTAWTHFRRIHNVQQ